MDVDFRELLRKYLRHIRGMEGVTFVDDLQDDDPAFRVDELAALRALADQVEADYTARFTAVMAEHGIKPDD